MNPAPVGSRFVSTRLFASMSPDAPTRPARDRSRLARSAHRWVRRRRQWGLGRRRRHERLPGRAGLRGRRLRRLPHDEGRGRDGHNRPEPRRAEAEQGNRRPPGDERRQRHAGVQGRADRRGDRPGRRLRRDRRRSGLCGQYRVRARRQDNRGLRPGRGLPGAGVREPRVRGRAEGGPRQARRDADGSNRGRGVPPDRAQDRSGRPPPLRGGRRSRRSSRGTGRAAPATTTACSSGSSPV